MRGITADVAISSRRVAGHEWFFEEPLEAQDAARNYAGEIAAFVHRWHRICTRDALAATERTTADPSLLHPIDEDPSKRGPLCSG
jgi:hypothetical protein